MASLAPVLDEVVVNSVVSAQASDEHGMVQSCPGTSDGAVHSSRIVL